MTKKKIKVIDIVDNDKKDDDYTVIVDEINANEVCDAIGPVSDNDIEITTNEEPQLENVMPVVLDDTTKIRQHKLVKCEKCNKWVTEKTMKYTHSKTCGDVKKKQTNKNTETPNISLPYKQPNPVKIEPVVKQQQVLQRQLSTPIVKESVNTYEEMRKDRLNERLKQRSEKHMLLFKQVF